MLNAFVHEGRPKRPKFIVLAPPDMAHLNFFGGVGGGAARVDNIKYKMG
jgi:hypothetical protein